MFFAISSRGGIKNLWRSGMINHYHLIQLVIALLPSYVMLPFRVLFFMNKSFFVTSKRLSELSKIEKIIKKKKIPGF